MNKVLIFTLLTVPVPAWADGIDFNAGADLRIRQEIMHNVPGLPGGGIMSRAPYGKTKNHIRIRPDVWGEVKFGESLRVYTRLTDEFRWNTAPTSGRSAAWPDEVILDNLYLDGIGFFDGFLDFRVGRQDIYGLYGLDHVFQDGTPGDGSRTVYADMARLTLHVDEVSKLDFFALYNFDESDVRWGTHRSRHRSLTGLTGGRDSEMDDWGWGAVYSSELFDGGMPYQIFALQKNTASCRIGGVKRAREQRETFGVKAEPRLWEDPRLGEFKLQLEAMGQVGENGRDDTLSGWSSYAGLNWKGGGESGHLFGKMGFHVMSGDEDAAMESGGHRGWDPIWARGVCDSEMFLYGTHYGLAWWTNMMFFKFTLGYEFDKFTRLTGSTGPMFAEQQDGLGGGEGTYKGLLSQLRFDFPLWNADGAEGRFRVIGHLIGEFFNPGDYYSTDRPAYFVRWQVEFHF